MSDSEQNRETINTLLDINHFYGQSSGRTLPIVITICLGGLPILVYLYFGLWNYLPKFVVIPVYLFYLMRIVMIFLLDEKGQLDNYRNTLLSKYDDLDSIVKVRNIDSKGCVHYVNGTIAYAVVAYNGTITKKVAHSKVIKKFLEQVLDRNEFEILIQNINDFKVLDTRYKNLDVRGDPLAIASMLKIIEYNKNSVRQSSKLQRIVIVIFGRADEKDELYVRLSDGCNSRESKAFKEVYVAGPRELEDICNKDVDGYVDFSECLIRKYATNNYRNSKVLYYDDVEVTANTHSPDTTGFMVQEEEK